MREHIGVKARKRLAGAAFLFAAAAFTAGGALALERSAALLMDVPTGQVLFAEDVDSQRYPASLTKMMTLYLAFEAVRAGKLKLDTPLKVSARAAAQAPSKLGLRAGDQVVLRDLVLGLTVQSANDAAVVVAEALGGDERRFAEQMTRKARALGMNRTTFLNASGLPNRGQVTTARDMATLGRALLRTFPQEYRFFSVAEFEYGGRTYRTHNHLLGDYAGADGIKTGYIRASGYNLVASAERNGRRLLGVVFGGTTARRRDLHMQAMLDKGFAMEPPRGVAAADSPRSVAAAVAQPRPKPAAPPKIMRGPVVAEVKPKPNGTAPAEIEAAEESPEVGSVASPDAEQPRDWGVQVGAYAVATAAGAAATQAVDAFPDLLGDTEIRLLEVRVAKKRLYRAWLVGLEEKDATAACVALAQRSIQCMLVKPSGSVSVAPGG